MNKLFTTILIASFIGIAMFGVFDMHAESQNHDGRCAFAASQGADCPKKVNPVDYISFHFNALKNLSTAIFNDGFFISFLLLALFMLGISLETLQSNIIHPNFSFVYRWHELKQYRVPPKHQFLRWLALHENSPTFSSRTLI